MLWDLYYHEHCWYWAQFRCKRCKDRGWINTAPERASSVRKSPCPDCKPDEQ